MEKEINGKVYELVTVNKNETPCNKCAFDDLDGLHGCKIGINECSNIGNERKYWKLKTI